MTPEPDHPSWRIAPTEPRHRWWDRFTWPFAALSDIQGDVAFLRRGALEINNRLAHVEKLMADNSPLLNQLAQDLRSFAAGPFAALLADNARLAVRNAELEGEDAAESSAATNAVSAFNELVNPVTVSPDVPVEIPPVDVPDAPTEEPPTEPEPTPAA